MITKDEIQELLHSTETYRVERTTSTDERSKSRGQARLSYALQGGRRREPAGDMDKFQEAICAFANDNGGKDGGDVALIEMTDIQKSIIDLIGADASISIDLMAVKMAVKKRTLERNRKHETERLYLSNRFPSFW